MAAMTCGRPCLPASAATTCGAAPARPQRGAAAVLLGLFPLSSALRPDRRVRRASPLSMNSAPATSIL